MLFLTRIGQINSERTGGASLTVTQKQSCFYLSNKRFEELKFFIIDDDEAIINRLPYNLNKFNKKDKNVKLVSLKLSVDAHRKLKKNEISRLTDTTKDFFH